MRRSGLLKLFIPELLKGVGVKQPKPFHKDDVYWHSLYCCDEISRDKPVLRLAALLHDIAKPKCKVKQTFYNHDIKGAEMAFSIMKRLKFSNDNIAYVTNLVKNHMFNYSSVWTDAGIRRFIRRAGLESLDDLFELRAADIRSMGRPVEKGHPIELRKRIAKILKSQNALHIGDLKINGNDVMKAMDIPPGPRVGEILSKLLDKVLDKPELNNKANLLEIIKKIK